MWRAGRVSLALRSSCGSLLSSHIKHCQLILSHFTFFLPVSRGVEYSTYEYIWVASRKFSDIMIRPVFRFQDPVLFWLLDPGSCQPGSGIREGKNWIRSKHPKAATLILSENRVTDRYSTPLKRDRYGNWSFHWLYRYRSLLFFCRLRSNQICSRKEQWPTAQRQNTVY